LNQRSIHIVTLLTAPLFLASVFVGPVEARRGGSFGSRGSRTYDAPRSSYGSSRYVPPIERSMTPRSTTPRASASNPGFGAQPYAPQRSRFGGFGGGLLGGLVAGGLIGHFLGGGSGWGGGGAGGGFLMSLIQIAILGGIVWLVVGFFRRRRTAPQQAQQGYYADNAFTSAANNSPWGGSPQTQTIQEAADITLTSADQNAFEQLLVGVQDAFGRENYARLRELTTPEIMSYLAEELSENATHNRRNEVTGTRLIDAEVLEAWTEASGDYATIGLRYESIDVMRDRTTGGIVSGSADTATEANEVWTFFRDTGGVWKLSAIQEA
jgi:predicted lipid-binding transport protein (Tim44 family)